MHILVIDNYDSFTYNLVQLVGCFTTDIAVKRNDRVVIKEIIGMKPAKIIISPGPGHPRSSAVSLDVIRELGTSIPVLGVCLGHQGIAMQFGCEISPAPALMHGKTSQIGHNGAGIFRGVAQNFNAARYHSLIVKRDTIPDSMEVTAWTEDGLVMGVRHRTYPLNGIQFHPESFMTTEGKNIIKNWLEL
jgi:anthranilate synthase/aminodeoxychorismate synthase-like glutamine amidotransferase